MTRHLQDWQSALVSRSPFQLDGKCPGSRYIRIAERTFVVLLPPSGTVANGHLEHSVPSTLAHDIEFEIDQIAIRSKLQQFLELSAEYFGRSVDVPAG